MNLWPIAFCSPGAIVLNATGRLLLKSQTKTWVPCFCFTVHATSPGARAASSRMKLRGQKRGPPKGVGIPLLIFQRHYPAIMFRNITHHRKFPKEHATII